MDVLEADDRESARRARPAEKLAQALEVMSAGIRLKRGNLRRQFPGDDDSVIDRLLTAWLTHDD